jgi:anti-anti-sigma regulatory factor
MTVSTRRVARPPPNSTGTSAVEVASTCADTLRVTIRITGSVSRAAVPMLTTVLHTHLRAGRRHLCIDLGSAELGMDAVRALAAAADAGATLGGALVFANAQPGVAEAIESVRRTPARP